MGRKHASGMSEYFWDGTLELSRLMISSIMAAERIRKVGANGARMGGLLKPRPRFRAPAGIVVR